MKVAKNASFAFWLYRSKQNSDGLVPVYMRIASHGQKTELSTGLHVSPTDWDKKQCRVKGESLESSFINEQLENFTRSFYEACNAIRRRDGVLNVAILKRLILGEEISNRTLLELMTYHNKQVGKLVGSDYTASTHKRYLITEKLVSDFLKSQKRADIPLNELGHKFLNELEVYLKADKHQQHNTAIKYLKNLKVILNKGVLWEWIEKNPFNGYKTTEKNIYKDFLTSQEVSVIEGKTFNIARLENVKKAFLFQCYTGLAYSDIASLTQEDIREHLGATWIWRSRDKTGNPIRVPLSDKALALIDLNARKPINIMSNQRMNCYLKEIADTCSIHKHLTTHCARRTFATLSLTEGVSIESVASMLGHSNISVTQKHYARVQPEKILAEMKHN